MLIYPCHLTFVKKTFAEQPRILKKLAKYADARGNGLSFELIITFCEKISRNFTPNRVLLTQFSAQTYSQYLQLSLDLQYGDILSWK